MAGIIPLLVQDYDECQAVYTVTTMGWLVYMPPQYSSHNFQQCGHYVVHGGMNLPSTTIGPSSLPGTYEYNVG